MTINWWTLGLQAVNVLILVWLLSRVFWRPVAAAITKRQEAAQIMLDDAKAAQSKADDALAKVTETRAGIAEERTAVLNEAASKAERAAKASLAEARTKAEALTKIAQTAMEREATAARADAVQKSALLATDIARKLLDRLSSGDIQTAFLGLLIEAIEKMPDDDRATLTATSGGIVFVSAAKLQPSQEQKIAKAVRQALGGTPQLTFSNDPDLIAGFELRTPHFVLHNSWKSDLEDILKDLNNAA